MACTFYNKLSQNPRISTYRAPSRLRPWTNFLEHALDSLLFYYPMRNIAFPSNKILRNIKVLHGDKCKQFAPLSALSHSNRRTLFISLDRNYIIRNVLFTARFSRLTWRKKRCIFIKRCFIYIYIHLVLDSNFIRTLFRVIYKFIASFNKKHQNFKFMNKWEW